MPRWYDLPPQLVRLRLRRISPLCPNRPIPTQWEEMASSPRGVLCRDECSCGWSGCGPDPNSLMDERTTTASLWTKNDVSLMEEERPHQQTGLQRHRHLGIDALRYGWAFAVVLAHALPWSAPVPLWAVLVWAACLPSIPFFFIVAGYFLQPQERFGGHVIVRPLRRLMPIYLFWMFAYFLLLKIIPLRTWSFSLHDCLWGGTAVHLWFLPALCFALVFVGTGLSLVGPRLTGLACAVLAGIALTRGAYHDVLHLPGAPSTHNGQLAGPMYVYIGAMLARRRIAVKGRWLAAMVVLAYSLFVGEQLLIARWTGEPLNMNHDVVLSGFIMGTAVFLAGRNY